MIIIGVPAANVPIDKAANLMEDTWYLFFQQLSTRTAYQINPAAVTLTGGTVNGITIGATTPSTGRFTDVTNGNAAALIKSSVSLIDGAGAGAGTLTNAPAPGNPSKWIPFDDNGVIRYIPTW